MIPVNQRIILDLCGGTGAWSRDYAEAGYDVRNITLPDYDVRDYVPPNNVYGILAAPPCNEFSIAKGSQPRDFGKGMKIVKACLECIWIARMDGVLRWWCLENPRGFLRQFLGKPAYTIRYWWYGDGLDKLTDLWGYFNLPPRRYKEPPELLEKIKSMPGGTEEERNLHRAVTPPCFAQAFFKANP
jgi:hypothetical protein